MTNDDAAYLMRIIPNTLVAALNERPGSSVFKLYLNAARSMSAKFLLADKD